MQRAALLSAYEFYFILDILFKSTSTSIIDCLMPNSGCLAFLKGPIISLGEHSLNANLIIMPCHNSKAFSH